MGRRVITGSGKNVREYVKQMGDSVIAFPETQLDVNEQAGYVNTLFEDGPDIVTLSPWIISDTLEDDLFVLDDDLYLNETSFNTYGASVNKITMKVLGRHCTMGTKSKAELESYADNIENYTVADIDYKFGESVEKMLVLKLLFDRERNL